jgi:hypothetical protein
MIEGKVRIRQYLERHGWDTVVPIDYDCASRHNATLAGISFCVLVSDRYPWEIYKNDVEGCGYTRVKVGITLAEIVVAIYELA